MRVGVPKESGPNENRVALTPPAVPPLLELGLSVAVERGAGEAAGFTDAEYQDAGAEIVADGAAAHAADMVLRVGPPTVADLEMIPEGGAVAGFLEPFSAEDIVHCLARRRITGLALEAVPRTTLAQGIDALSSQATAAGYEAVLVAATAAKRFFPMFTTAAGTIRPAKVLVLGAGVAGLQAIATARRLGAVVSGYDIRPEAREQVESLGARFVAAPTFESAAGDDGYARQVAADVMQQQLDSLRSPVSDSDVVITTAQIPGRPAPLLVTREMVEDMRPGSVVVDLAAASGGNCELTVPDETIVHRNVSVLGPTDLASRVAHDASQMLARNLLALLEHGVRDGELHLDFSDEILDGTTVTHNGDVRHPAARRLLGMEAHS